MRTSSVKSLKELKMPRGQVSIQIDRDLPIDRAYVDRLLASSLDTGRCAKILRNLMIIFGAGIPQRAQGRDYLFDPEAICQTIKVLEKRGGPDLTRGPIRYNNGPLTGLYKKHFFQASFLPENISQEIKREGAGILHRKLSEHYGQGKYLGKTMDETDLRLMAEAVSSDTIERRAERRENGRKGGLTGEHLIYAETLPGNIYLYASFHGEDSQRIVDSVAVSFQEFPELAGIAPVFEGGRR